MVATISLAPPPLPLLERRGKMAAGGEPSGRAAIPMPTCLTCRREVADGTSFCPACGTALLPPAIAAMVQDAHRALASNPHDAAAHHNLAIAYRLGGMDEMALHEFSRVAELQPDFADVHYELGALHAKHGRTQDAIAALRRAQQLDPADTRPARLLRKLMGDQ